MDLHGDFAGPEFRRYLFVEHARNHQGHHFARACGQLLVVLSQLANFAPRLTRYPVTIQCLMNRIQQVLAFAENGVSLPHPSLLHFHLLNHEDKGMMSKSVEIRVPQCD
jgi:hypothetical protein